MRLVIRKKPGPIEVPLGDEGAVVLVNRITADAEAEMKDRLRAAGGGIVPEAAVGREIRRASLAGWRGLRDADTGEEIPFGPCPACGGAKPGTAPVAPTAPETPALTPVRPVVGGNAGAPAPCAGCGGSGDARDWFIRQAPARVWDAILEESLRTYREEKAVSGN